MSKLLIINQCSECCHVSQNYTSCVLDHKGRDTPSKGLPDWCTLLKAIDALDMVCRLCGSIDTQLTIDNAIKCPDCGALYVLGYRPFFDDETGD